MTDYAEWNSEKTNKHYKLWLCLRGSESALLAGLALFTGISAPCEIPSNISFRLRVKRASPPKRDLPIDYTRSCIEGLEIYHVSRGVGTTIKVGRGGDKVPISVWVCLTAWSKGKNSNDQWPSLYRRQNDNLNVVPSRTCDSLKVRLLNPIHRPNL